MDRLERLARDICWAGFTNPRTATGCSKAEYWKHVSAAAKADYRKDASHILYWVDKLGIERIRAALPPTHSSTQGSEKP